MTTTAGRSQWAGRRLHVLAAALLAMAALLLVAPPAQAARPLVTGFTDLRASSDADQNFLLDKVARRASAQSR